MKCRLLSVFLLFITTLVIISCSANGEYQDRTESKKNTSRTDTLTAYSEFISYSSNAAKGEAVYIPVYSHIYQRNAQRTFNLTATLSIRNTDLLSSMTVNKVYYYDSQGNLVQKYVDSPIKIAPLSSISYVVEENDLKGGVGANFLVLWEAQNNITQPVIESVMISAAQSQGISFVSEGRIIHSLNVDSLPSM